jgi:single-strand DNA-binding protein
MYAKMTLIGNVGRDPEVKTSASGVKFARFVVAINKISKGEKTTQWIDVVVFNEKTCDVVETYIRKGTKVFVEGEPTVRAYAAKTGEAKAQLELVVGKFDGRILMLSGREDAPAKANVPDLSSDDDDSIPF